MVDIIVHEVERLVSIKGVDFEDEDFMYFYSLIYDLIKDSCFVLITVKRPNYIDSLVELLKKEDKFLKIKDLKISADNFEVSFYFNSKDVSKEILFMLIDLWHAFQHVVYYFFPNNEIFNLFKKRLLKNNYNWEKVVNFSSCFLLFKGVEDDVIWLAKSYDLKFREGIPPQE